VADFYIKQNDTRPVIAVQATYDDGSTIENSFIGATVKFHLKTAAGVLLVNKNGEVADADGQIIRYVWQTNDTVVTSWVQDDSGLWIPGAPHEAEFQVTFADGGVETIPNTRNILVDVFPEIA
jgi:hypothetical protein